MGELAVCVISTNKLVVVSFALPRFVCAIVWEPAKWACVSGGVFVSEGESSIVEVAVYEFEYCHTFSFEVPD